MNDNNLKKHHNKEWLQEQLDAEKTSRDIAKEINVSYKLIELYLRQFNLDFTSQKREIWKKFFLDPIWTKSEYFVKVNDTWSTQTNTIFLVRTL